MNSFREWVMMREMGEPMGKPSQPMGNVLSPEKKKVFDEVKKMLVGSSGANLIAKDPDDITSPLMVTSGILGTADKIEKAEKLAMLVDMDGALDGLSHTARDTNDPNVLDEIIDKYYMVFTRNADNIIKRMQAAFAFDRIEFNYKEIINVYVPIIHGLEEAKLKILSITGKPDRYVGDGDMRRSNRYANAAAIKFGTALATKQKEENAKRSDLK